MEGLEIVFAILMGLFALYVLGACCVNMVKSIRSMFNQTSWKENALPDPQAIIVDVNSQQVKYAKNDAKFKTTVTFSDGFVFTTHKTNRVNHFGSYTISVDRKQIAELAKAAHAKAVEKKQSKAPAPKQEAKAAVPEAAVNTVPENKDFDVPNRIRLDPIPLADPPEAFREPRFVPTAPDYPVTAPVTDTKSADSAYPVTAPVTKATPAADDYPVTAPVTKSTPSPEDYPVTAPVTVAKPAPEAAPETTRWICPKCGLVHSKTLAVCFHCGTEQSKANKFV